MPFLQNDECMNEKARIFHKNLCIEIHTDWKCTYFFQSQPLCPHFFQRPSVREDPCHNECITSYKGWKKGLGNTECHPVLKAWFCKSENYFFFKELLWNKVKFVFTYRYKGQDNVQILFEEKHITQKFYILIKFLPSQHQFISLSTFQQSSCHDLLDICF